MACYIGLVILVSVPLFTTESSFVSYKKTSDTDSKLSPSIRQVATNSLTQCVTICEHTEKCVGISYNSNGTCELNQYTQDAKLSTTVREHGWNVYEKRQGIALQNTHLKAGDGASKNKATSFTFGFLKNDMDTDNPTVYIVSSYATHVTLTSPSLGKLYEGTVVNGMQISLRDVFTIPRETGLFNRRLHLESNGSVDVYAENALDESADGSVVIPDNHLSNEYIILIGNENGGRDTFLVIGINDNTDVTITSPKGKLTTKKLRHDQVYYYMANKHVELSGTLISSSNTMAVFAGNGNVNMYRRWPSDHHYEQMPPISNLQKQYVVSFPYSQRRYGLRVLAVNDNTEIRLSGMSTRILNRTQYSFDYIEKRALAITATKQVMVAIYSLGNDGSYLIVPGLSQFKTMYTMYVPGRVYRCMLMVTYPSYISSIHNIRLNDVKLFANESVTVAVNGRGTYTILYVEVSKGTSVIYTVDETPFGAYLSFLRFGSESWFSLSYKF